jgi:hypothetical protein
MKNNAGTAKTFFYNILKIPFTALKTLKNKNTHSITKKPLSPVF